MIETTEQRRAVEILNHRLTYCEETLAVKVTKNTVFRAKLYRTNSTGGITYAGSVRKVTTWRGSGFVVEIYHYRKNGPHSLYSDTHVETEQEANHLLKEIGKVIFP